MGLYNYEKDLADVQDRYSQENATDQYARFISQQRFARQKDGMNRGFQQGFPGSVVQMNRGMGSRVKSGVFGDNLGRMFGNYNRQVGDVEHDQARQQAQFAQQQSMRDSAYQRALLLLQEQLSNERAGQSPFIGGA